MKRLCLFLLGLFFVTFPSFAVEKSPEEVVQDYIKETYDGYLSLERKDLSQFLDVDNEAFAQFAGNYNLLNARRAYLKEKDYCYVETQAFPLSVLIEDVEYLDDERVQVTFFLEGDREKAYPPYYYLGRNYYQLRKTQEGWRISSIAHQDIVFSSDDDYLEREKLSFEEQVRELKKSIDQEFIGEKMPLYDVLYPTYGPKSNPLNYLGRPGDYPYATERALNYIQEHFYEPSEEFVRIQENCANFTSQILYRGFFGTERVEIEEWHGFYGDFTRCWIYAGEITDYMIRPRFEDEEGPRAEVPESIYGLRQGGILEIKANPAETWAHVMQLVDYQKLVFSGNNYDGYRYYSDFLNHKRFFTPLYFRFQ